MLFEYVCFHFLDHHCTCSFNMYLMISGCGSWSNNSPVSRPRKKGLLHLSPRNKISVGLRKCTISFQTTIWALKSLNSRSNEPRFKNIKSKLCSPEDWQGSSTETIFRPEQWSSPSYLEGLCRMEKTGHACWDGQSPHRGRQGHEGWKPRKKENQGTVLKPPFVHPNSCLRNRPWNRC